MLKQSYKLPVILKITYLDSNWNLTERNIRISKSRSVQQYGYVRAYCLSKKEEREFKISRIQKCINVETGESISDIQTFMDDYYPKKRKNVSSVVNTPTENLLLFIEYVNADRWVFEKSKLSVARRFNNLDGTLVGYCLDDEKQKTINLASISKVIDAKTGKIISNFGSYFKDFLANTN